MKKLNITFIGAGNMARSLIGGLLADGKTPATISATDINEEQLTQLQECFNIKTPSSNIDAVAAADIVVLAVKPQVLKSVANEIKETVQKHKPLIISIAAGVREKSINQWLGGNVAIVRTMPNTPSLIQTGATALFANNMVATEQHDAAESIMRAVGLTLWVKEESQMDAVTAISGSGPAYFFLFMEAMEASGKALGLEPETARLLTLQTAFGATKMALESTESCATLRQRVTSPGGTTAAALNTFEQGELRQLVDQAVKAAANRSEELAQQLAEDC